MSTLAERLKDPEFAKKVKHAGIRLDLEDQRWMLEEIERLTRERDEARALLQGERGKQWDAAVEVMRQRDRLAAALREALTWIARKDVVERLSAALAEVDCAP